MTTPKINQEASRWIQQINLSQFSQPTLIEQACAFTSSNSFAQQQGLEIADIVLLLTTDSETIAASILYPVVSQNKVLLNEIWDMFGRSIYKLIDGVMQMDVIHQIKASKDRVTAQQNQIDNLRKMLLAMVDDIRIVLIKLSEQLMLLKNSQEAKPNFQKKIAQDTMDYYAPLANRLGIGHLKRQLEDWSFRYLHPLDYKNLTTVFQKQQHDREHIVQSMMRELKILLDSHHISPVEIFGRTKHIYSIYRKIQRKSVDLNHIYDTNGIRILVATIDDCYTALSIIHEKWSHISAEFDDYIMKPKKNGYQSIHTAIQRSDHSIVEIQIRTFEMHEHDELGVAAHWKYKENQSKQTDYETKISWLRSVLTWKKVFSKADRENQIYNIAFKDRVYVFSPNGDVFDLPAKATPLDFAYLIHSEIGHRCKGAKVNRALVPLTHQLKTGDRVEILTKKEGHPSRDWLRPDSGCLTTANAFRKVRQWFRKKENQENPLIYPAKTAESETKESETILIASKSKQLHNSLPFDLSNKEGSILLTQLAKCCNPIPGDSILGYITMGKGITIHQKHCPNIQKNVTHRSHKIIDVNWKFNVHAHYRLKLSIKSEDRPGLLRDISGVITQLHLSILDMNSHVDEERKTAHIQLTLEITDQQNTKNILQKLRLVNGVVQVERK